MILLEAMEREGVTDSPWYGAGGPSMSTGGGHTYAAMMPFVPEEEIRPYVNPVTPWETAVAGAGSAGGRTSTTSYPPEIQSLRYSNMSTSSASVTLLSGASGSGSGSRQHSRHNQSHLGSVVTLSLPNVESTSHHSYFGPYADSAAGSSSNDNYRSMNGKQRQVVNTTYRRHEDSGVR
ncbi:hypothetical protein PM082_008945 [Marasmius tenuissimus]|nr:hypothetical protein PM082_008945 [Marasmius tenuissimus]